MWVGETKHCDDSICTEFGKVFMYIIIEKVKEIQQVVQMLVGTSLHCFCCPALKTSQIKGKFLKVWKKSCGSWYEMLFWEHFSLQWMCVKVIPGLSN